MPLKWRSQRLKVFGIIASIGVLLFLFHEEIPILQNIHPVVFGFVLVVAACIFFNFLGQKQFGPTKRRKFNLSEQIPGLLIASVVLLIVMGFAANSKVNYCLWILPACVVLSCHFHLFQTHGKNKKSN